MDKEADKKLDEFTGKMLADFSRETPSFDFTTRVMSKVENLSSLSVIKYKPLISNKLWMILAVSVFGIFSYLIFGDVQLENSVPFASRLNFIPNYDDFTLPSFKVSNVFLYAVIGFAFFISIQILLLKNHFDKRYAMD